MLAALQAMVSGPLMERALLGGGASSPLPAAWSVGKDGPQAQLTRHQNRL